MILKKIIKMTFAAAFFTGISSPSLAQDAAAGADVFRKCATCHSAEESVKKIGPSLFGVVGRTPGTFEGFRYSPAMTAFGADGKVWTEDLLNSYLKSPRTLVPGNRMGFPGLMNEQDRLDVIAYLKTLK